MTDPRIQFFEDNMKRDPIGHGCHVIRMRENSFRVIGYGDDSIYKEHQDKEYTGNILFNVNRSGKRHVIIPVKGVLEEASAIVEDTRIPWIPSIMFIALAPDVSPDPLTLPRDVDCHVSYDIESEPDPLIYNATYGVGHTYWLEIDIDEGNGGGAVNVFAAGVLAGVSTSFAEVVYFVSGSSIVTEARLYSGSGGTLLDTESYLLIP